MTSYRVEAAVHAVVRLDDVRFDAMFIIEACSTDHMIVVIGRLQRRYATTCQITTNIDARDFIALQMRPRGEWHQTPDE